MITRWTKRQLIGYAGLLALCLLLLAPFKAQAANKYLQKFENYSVMSMGDNVLRFTIPLWVYGKGSDNFHYLEAHWDNNDNKKDSYIWYSLETGSQSLSSPNVHRIASFGADRGGNYGLQCTGCVGYAYLLPSTGSVVVRNTYSGMPLTITENDRSYWCNQRIEVKRKNTSYVDHVVFIQFNWYMPEELQNKSFSIGLNQYDYYAKDGDDNTHHWFHSGRTGTPAEIFRRVRSCLSRISTDSRTGDEHAWKGGCTVYDLPGPDILSHLG